MRETTERRTQILEYISDKRCVHMQQIADEFGISVRTAQRDVQILSCSYPIITEYGCQGGIRAMEGWYLNHRYLRDDEEKLLRELLEYLLPDKQETLKNVIQAFSKPKH